MAEQVGKQVRMQLFQNHGGRARSPSPYERDLPEQQVFVGCASVATHKLGSTSIRFMVLGGSLRASIAIFA
jgi:hypothetical protein